MMRGKRLALAAGISLALAAGTWLAPLHGNDRTASAAASSEWPSYGLDGSEQRFSPLSQINRDTVRNLGLAWYHEFDTDRGQQATPLMVDGVIYTSTLWSKVYAFDAGTGRLLWQFDPEVPKNRLVRGCCDAGNRGVGYWQGKIFVATFDGRLIALSAKTGKQIWSTQTFDLSKPYTSTGEVRVIKGKVLIGNSGAEYGVRGYVSAYVADSGKLAWRFYTVPNPKGEPDGAASDKILAEKARGTWFGEGWKRSGGGGTVWDAMAYDPEADLLYVGVGNGSPHNHLYRSDGKGDNLFLSSILALRPDTGEYVWHYQTSPGDSWDFTSTQSIILTNVNIDGRPRKVLMHAPKNGFFYVLDRLTGELLSAKNFVDMNWASGIDMKTGRPIEAPNARYTKGPWTQMPGSMGAHSWHPMAYDPLTGLAYIPAQVVGQTYTTDEHFKYREGLMNVGLDTRKLSLPDDPVALAKAKAATYGKLIAWDPLTQSARWTVRYPSYVNGGVLATAGGLVFQGTATGELNAYDAATGKTLWSYETVNGIIAPPITYSLRGRQYIAVMVGFGGSGGILGTFVPERPALPGRLMVFALGAKAKAKPYDIPPIPVPDLTGVSSTGDPIAGLAAFNSACIACHGINARGNLIRDLRRSLILHSPDAWKNVVIDGALSDLGMASFAQYLTPGDAEDVRAFVLSEARKITPEPDKAGAKN